MRAPEEEQAKLSNIETSTAALAHLTTFHERPRHTSSNRLGTASLIARDMGCSQQLSAKEVWRLLLLTHGRDACAWQASVSQSAACNPGAVAVFFAFRR